MIETRSNIFSFLKRMYERYKHEQVTSIAGELSYFLLLSLFPLLFVLLQVIALMPIDQDLLLNFIREYVPEDAETIIEAVVKQVLNQTSKGILSFGLLGTFWSASRGTNALIRSMNRSFDVEESRPAWKVLIMSFLIVIGIIFVVVFSLLIPIFGQRILNILYSIFELPIFATLMNLNAIRYLLMFIVLFFSFTVAYCIIPNQKLSIKDAMPGALFTTVGWVIATFLFSFYVENFSTYSATYGSIGSVIVLMTWVYLSCTVIILGGILNSEIIIWRKNKV